MITIFDGDMDNGKSTTLALLTLKLLEKNKKNFEKGRVAIRRMLYTTQSLASWIYEKFAGYIKQIPQEQTLEIAPTLEECDFMYDDMNMDMDGQHYMDTPRDFKAWLRQCGHRGVDIYGNTQDFLTLDPTVRRLAKNIYNVRMHFGNDRPCKSKPPVKRLHGLILIRRVHEVDRKKEKPEREYDPLWKFWNLEMHIFTKNKAALFDTNQRMVAADLPPYRCYERHCTNPEHKDAYGRPFRQFYHAK